MNSKKMGNWYVHMWGIFVLILSQIWIVCISCQIFSLYCMITFLGKLHKVILTKNQHFFNDAWIGGCISNSRMMLNCSLKLLHFWGCITQHLTIIMILVVERIDYFCHRLIVLCHFLLICFSCRFIHRSSSSSRTTNKIPRV